MNTNHNIWTLSKHVAGSINKAAGTVDQVVYGPKPPPTPMITKDMVFGGVGILLIVVWAFVWLNRWDRLKDRIMR